MLKQADQPRSPLEVLQARFNEFYWGEDDEDDGALGLDEEQVVQSVMYGSKVDEATAKSVIDAVVENGGLVRRKSVLIYEGKRLSIN